MKGETSNVPTGFPSPALDYMEERIDLNKEYIKHPLATFFAENVGDSMINAFIPPQSKLIIDRSLTPKNGDIILAVLNGEFIVRFLKKNPVRSWLCPANRKYQDIEITPELDFKVWGVVTAIITHSNDVRKCMP